MRVASSQRMLGHGPSAGCNLNRANHNEPGYIMKLWHIHLQIQHGEIPSLKRELIHNGQSEGLKKLKERPSFSPCGGRRAQLCALLVSKWEKIHFLRVHPT